MDEAVVILNSFLNFKYFSNSIPEIDLSVFRKSYINLLEIWVELQLVVVEHFVLWAGFSFELHENAKQNTSNRMIIDARKLSSGQ